MSETNTVVIVDNNNTVTIVDNNTVAVLQEQIEVISVGVQGPSGASTIGGKSLPEAAPTDDDLVIFDATQDRFVYTKVLDSGTFGD